MSAKKYLNDNYSATWEFSWEQRNIGSDYLLQDSRESR